jgi:uncharacterized RDD family membrane protein YckC
LEGLRRPRRLFTPRRPRRRPGSGGRLRLPGFWRRFFAVLIDGVITQVIVIIPALGVGIAIGIAGAASGQTDEALQALGGILGVVIGLGIGWLYEAGLMASSKQATIGKMALGLVVTDLAGSRLTFGRATGRYFAKIVSSLTLMIGYLMQPFTEKRQALHDLLAGTLVIKK